MAWVETTLGDLVALQRGFDLPTKDRVPGKVPVLSAGEKLSSHNEAKVPGPGFVIGRSSNLGVPRWSDEDFWPLNTTLFAKDFKGNNPRWLFYLFQTLDLTGFNSGTAQASLNRNYISGFKVTAPGRPEQDRIVGILGSLDDKIAANSHAIEKSLNLQSAIWEAGTLSMPSVPLLEVAEPTLGGTPSRKDETSWGGGYKWASVTDMTASPRSHLINTAETISAKAAKKKRFSPLPAGSVLLSARGTVGRVVSLAEPASFNQSAYGFKAIPGFEAALRLAITSVVDELRAKSYGSVFSTITKTQINEATVPAVFDDPNQPLHQELNTLEYLIVALERENNTLAKTRDELLPLLMSGKITVKEAGQEAAAAGAQIQSEENEE